MANSLCCDPSYLSKLLTLATEFFATLRTGYRDLSSSFGYTKSLLACRTLKVPVRFSFLENPFLYSKPRIDLAHTLHQDIVFFAPLDQRARKSTIKSQDNTGIVRQF
jgi:hypothetical protein